MEQGHRKALECQWIVLYFAFLFCFWQDTSAQIRYSIPEEVKDGAVVGNIAKDLGLDSRTLTDRRFRIVSGSKDPPFQVNQNDGALYVSKNIDREEMCERNSVCLINLKTVLENPLEIHYVAVEVLDVNDNSPEFLEKEKRLEIAESVLPGARFQLQAARDPDAGVNSVQVYKLGKNEHFQLEVKDRGDDKKIPFLILHKPLDRETNTEHKLLLIALDGGNPQRSGTQTIIIDVLDVNDNTPVFDQDIYSVTLQENVPIGTKVIQLNATDLDDGQNGNVVYSFGSNINSKVYEVFDLDSKTGEITVKGLIDFEEQESYEIDIQASDNGQAPLTIDSSVIVKIQDMNDNVPEIEVTSFSSTVSEDSRPGTMIALISVNDRDSGVNGQVFCVLSENIPFELKSSFQDNMYSLVTKAVLDREVVSQYSITIIAKDNGQPSLSSVKTITVDISDVNDKCPEFSQSPYTFYLSENNVPGQSILSVSASDEDLNENAHISYEIWKGDKDDNSMVPYLNVNSENGNVYALKSFDFEELKNFKFIVTARDSGVPSLSSTVAVNVFILDQNDNAPVVLFPLSANGSAETVVEIPRSVNAGHLVTKVRAYDADIGYNAWLSFSLLQVTDPSLFSLQRYTGEIRTLRPLTEADGTEHKLIVQVKDNGNYSLSTTATVLIVTIEKSESFAVSDFKLKAAAQEENNSTFYLIISLGSVSFLFVISVITLVTLQCCRLRNNLTSRSLRDSKYSEVSGNGTLCHSIQYRAGEKRYMLVGPRTSIGSTIGVGSNRNTLVISEPKGNTSEVSKPPNADWRYSASLRAGMQSSVHMEESAILQGAPGVLVQNWPTVSSATGGEPEGGEVSPPVGAGINSNSWSFRYGPGPGHPQALKPGEVPEAFIIPGSPAIISIRQDQPTGDDKSDFITFGKKEETKKKKKKKKGKADKKEKGNNDNSEQ
ncbi:protocadherin alpha-8-like isoform X10 [Lepisosteus oculatus]|uniref:protocadherin alpha-8-like isoform X10 n=1 Tax=Lepisosteus oculatus TaxID=7918 RepID=UPI0035F51858